jgi:hypothetical protein
MKYTEVTNVWQSQAVIPDEAKLLEINCDLRIKIKELEEAIFRKDNKIERIFSTLEGLKDEDIK